MKIICTGRKVSLKENFNSRVAKRLAKFDKFFSDSAEAKVTVTVEKDWHTVEITVRDKGFTCRAEKSADQMENAFDDAAELLERRIVKNRKRLDNRVLQQAFDEYAPEEDPELESEADYKVIREKHFTVKPCITEEAILQMEMLGHSFYMFRDADTDEINVVYARKNGSYGLLIPEQ